MIELIHQRGCRGAIACRPTPAPSQSPTMTGLTLLNGTKRDRYGRLVCGCGQRLELWDFYSGYWRARVDLFSEDAA